LDTIQSIEKVGVCDLIYVSGSRPSGGHKFITRPDTLTANQNIERDTRVGKRLFVCPRVSNERDTGWRVDFVIADSPCFYRVGTKKRAYPCISGGWRHPLIPRMLTPNGTCGLLFMA